MSDFGQQRAVVNTRPRPDGKAYRQRVNYSGQWLCDDRLRTDPDWRKRYAGTPEERLEACQRIWRRLRAGRFDTAMTPFLQALCTFAEASGEHLGNKRPRKSDRPKCGAKCRDGHACQAPVAWNPHFNRQATRCRLHGGLSSGPRSPEGKLASLAALNRARSRNA
jgi:hypothetical protein